MPAGSLREKVTFQRQTTGADDGHGNTITGWADLDGATGIRAQLRPAKQSEIVIAEGIQGRVLYEVTVRRTSVSAGITQADRMVDARDATRIFNVKSPATNPDQHGKYVKILVEAGGASG